MTGAFYVIDPNLHVQDRTSLVGSKLQVDIYKSAVSGGLVFISGEEMVTGSTVIESLPAWLLAW